MLNDSFNYRHGTLYCDEIPLTEIMAQVGTPAYVYSLRRALNNLTRIRTAFSDIDPHIHFSAKSNANLAILKALNHAGAGIDAVSAGEIHRALLAGVSADNIVFAGAGKTPNELAYALKQGVGWFNVENLAELQQIDNTAALMQIAHVRVALRLNPEVTASTHPHIATGHGGAKFGMTAEAVQHILEQQKQYPHVDISGIHFHIGSQLHDTDATRQALQTALQLIRPYPNIRTLNIGGGFPVAYQSEDIPSLEAFADTLTPLLKGYNTILEPGRSIIADAGILITTILYVKAQAGQIFYITDSSMSELIRPALYDAQHEIVPIIQVLNNDEAEKIQANVVGPVCESADVLGRGIPLPEMAPGEPLAILTAGAYGMVMASNYNQRPRPPEVVVEEDGHSWRLARRRETWEDMLRMEAEL